VDRLLRLLFVLRYDLVDVFTERPFAGNPLAVVRGAGALASEQLQAIAREFNLSETAFPAVPTPAEAASGAHYRVRIFTPGAEIPFAGHPSIGTAWVLRRDGKIPAGPVGQACGAGVVRLQVSTDDGPVKLSAAPRGLSEPTSPASALAAVGLTESDAVGGLRVGGCGLDFGYIRVRGDALGRATPSPAAMAAVPPRGDGEPLGGLCVYSVENRRDPLPVRSRVFCPDVGVLEDPATGSAALGLGLVLVADGLVPGDGEGAYVVRQGVELGRPSLLRGRVTASGGSARGCAVAGHVVPVGSGQIAVPRAG
jgi:trans-2,3-dihydro-3-hydroxyanthranilate isomerase